MAEPATRTLLVQDKNGRFKLTIPADAKVTFSSVNPSSRDYDKALRIYQNEKQQLACFVNVQWFRDLSLIVEREVIEEDGKTMWTNDEDNEVSQRSVKRTRTFKREEA
jgi:ATP/maltotriose-dependent transcriptional regulator MalT